MSIALKSTVSVMMIPASSRLLLQGEDGIFPDNAEVALRSWYSGGEMEKIALSSRVVPASTSADLTLCG